MWRDMPDAAKRLAIHDMWSDDAQPNEATDDSANVLVDANTDMTFLVAPNRHQVVTIENLYSPKIKAQLEMQLAKIKTLKGKCKEELWMYFDSGASRSVISTTSPIRSQLQSVSPAYGSCSIGDGTPLQYIEKGNVKDNLEITVVNNLKYDLFSSVHAAKQGLTSVIDFDLATGHNNSFTIDKTTGMVTPLVERGKGILELPLHLMIPEGACFTVIPTKGAPKIHSHQMLCRCSGIIMMMLHLTSPPGTTKQTSTHCLPSTSSRA
jgi:hypothetical protein